MSLSAEQITELRAIFSAIDANGNGTIEKDELRNLIVQMGAQVSDEELNAKFAEADINGDGTVDYAEFLAASE